MQYWWVNQKKTHRQEIGGGYLWSPKRRADQSRNRFYDNMKVVAPGDLVFSYWETAIRAYGTIRSFGYDAPKPDEFAEAGRNWAEIGYRADVDYTRLPHPVVPKAYWNAILPLLPSKYSPLDKATGNGLQPVYLAALPRELGELLFRLVAELGNPMPLRDSADRLLASREEREREKWERHELEALQQDPAISTEREALIRARRGQGKFRENIATIERACRVTRVEHRAYLIASHIKPWRHASNDERLSAENGLMLAPQVDFLFDRGFISFDEDELLVSPVADPESLVKFGIDPERPPRVGGFTEKQHEFLEFHRDQIFRRVG